MTKRKIITAVLGLGISFWLILFTVNFFVFETIRYYSNAANPCMTVAQVKADSRCLYIYHNQVYEKGTKAKIHHGHACGTDVSSILPSSHSKNVVKFLDPNYRADICTAQPTATPVPPTATPKPNPTPTSTPSPTPSPTPIPATPTPKPTLTPTPIPTFAPTATPVPGDALVSVVAYFHGIGTSGDSINPLAVGNLHPVYTQRSVALTFYDSNNQLIYTKIGVIIYAPQNGNFQGIIDLGDIATGTYLVKIKTEKYLIGSFQGNLQLTSGQTTNTPTITLVAGDVNSDDQLSILDYSILIGCYSDNLPPIFCSSETKHLSDLNDDGNVNQFDYNLFLRELSVQSSQ